MNIAHKIANALEFCADHLRGKTRSRTSFYLLHFRSRPDAKRDGKRMEGRQRFKTLDKAVRFMARGLAINQQFVKLEKITTLVTDADALMNTELKKLDVQFEPWIKEIYPDQKPQVFE